MGNVHLSVSMPTHVRLPLQRLPARGDMDKTHINRRSLCSVAWSSSCAPVFQLAIPCLIRSSNPSYRLWKQGVSRRRRRSDPCHHTTYNSYPPAQFPPLTFTFPALAHSTSHKILPTIYDLSVCMYLSVCINACLGLAALENLKGKEKRRKP
jgi:hypothetical protein